MKKILIINGHPDKKSFCITLAESCEKEANLAGTDCKLVHLIDLDFNPILTFGYRKVSELEPDLVKMQQEILAADHLVFVYPNWWLTFPALLKGFIERAFMPGFAFIFSANNYQK
ncbi:NAD(P)H-dependent oxidoreductase [Chamaesiphon sp. VAR_48_metabat_403]|uniref:NAD(P)H-dependent oxidoreductase n=1 Tax=Chamaesiphon sp. VAR_48_metabat_403 TaxID=2964700 RepID=UPI00286E8509|nr:NAD(P)H-dependent oxidoreductase [Chamaesiphon sp. VAR_48_metabat_403]